MKRDQYWNLEDYYKKGEKGDTGEQGPVGEQGPIGVKGEIGLKGLPGNNGSDGIINGYVCIRRFSYVIYKVIPSTEEITAPSGGSYNFVTKKITLPDGWSDSIDQVEDEDMRIYASLGNFSANTYEDKEIEGTWGKPYASNGLRGADSDYEEKIFIRTEENNLPDLPTDSQNIKGYCPAGWTNHPAGIDSDYPYEWVCTRTKTDDVWGEWVGPYTYNAIGTDGKDGDCIEYIYCVTSANTVPVNPTILGYKTDSNYQSPDWYPNLENNNGGYYQFQVKYNETTILYLNIPYLDTEYDLYTILVNSNNSLTRSYWSGVKENGYKIMAEGFYNNTRFALKLTKGVVYDMFSQTFTDNHGPLYFTTKCDLAHDMGVTGLSGKYPTSCDFDYFTDTIPFLFNNTLTEINLTSEFGPYLLEGKNVPKIVNYKNEIIDQVWTDNPIQVTSENKFQWYSIRKYTVKRYYNEDGTFSHDSKVYEEFSDPKRWNTFVVEPVKEDLNILGVIDNETYEEYLLNTGICQNSYYTFSINYSGEPIEFIVNETDKDYSLVDLLGDRTTDREFWTYSATTTVRIQGVTNTGVEHLLLKFKYFLSDKNGNGFATNKCDLISGSTSGTKYPIYGQTMVYDLQIYVSDTIQTGGLVYEFIHASKVTLSEGETLYYIKLPNGTIHYLTNGDGFVVDGSVYMFKDGNWEYYGSISAEELSGTQYYRYRLYSSIGDAGSDFNYDNFYDYYSLDTTTIDVRYMGICTTQSETPPQVLYNGTNYPDITKYIWYFIKGDDGEKEQYIYTRTKKNSLEDIPNVPMYTSDGVTPLRTLEEGEWDWIDENQVTWTDDSQGISKDWPYEWVCKRTKVDGQWSDYSGSIQKEGKAKLYLYYNNSFKDAENGVSYYYAGEWDKKTLYIRDTSKAPIVSISNSDGTSSYYYLYNNSSPAYSCNDIENVKEDSIPDYLTTAKTSDGKTVLKDIDSGGILTVDTTTPGSLKIWKEMTAIDAVTSEYLIADFAKLSEAIFCGGYMYSQYGTDEYDAEYSGYTDFYKFDPFYEINTYEYYCESGCTDETILERFGYSIETDEEGKTHYYDENYNEITLQDLKPSGVFLPNWCVDFKEGKMWCNNGRIVFNNSEGLVMYNNEEEKVFFIDDSGELQIAGTLNKPTHIIDDVDDLCQFFIPVPVSYADEDIVTDADYTHYEIGNVHFNEFDSTLYDVYLADKDKWGKDINKLKTFNEFYSCFSVFYDEVLISDKNNKEKVCSGVSPFFSFCYDSGTSKNKDLISNTTFEVEKDRYGYYNFKENCMLLNLSFDMSYTNGIFEFKNDFYQNNYIIKSDDFTYKDLFTDTGRTTYVKSIESDKLDFYNNGYNIIFPFLRYYDDIEEDSETGDDIVVKKIRNSRLTPTRLSTEKELKYEDGKVIYDKERNLHYITLDEMLLNIGKKIIIKNKSNKPIFLTTKEDAINHDSNFQTKNKYGLIHFVPTDDSLEIKAYDWHIKNKEKNWPIASCDYFNIIKKGDWIPINFKLYDFSYPDGHLFINNKGKVYISLYALDIFGNDNERYSLDDDGYFYNFRIIDYRKYLKYFQFQKYSHTDGEGIGTVDGQTFKRYNLKDNRSTEDSSKYPSHYVDFINSGEVATLEFVDEVNDGKEEIYWKVISITELPKNEDGEYIDD